MMRTMSRDLKRRDDIKKLKLRDDFIQMSAGVEVGRLYPSMSIDEIQIRINKLNDIIKFIDTVIDIVDDKSPDIHLEIEAEVDCRDNSIMCSLYDATIHIRFTQNKPKLLSASGIVNIKNWQKDLIYYRNEYQNRLEYLSEEVDCDDVVMEANDE